jgi:hypothetical protein
MGCLRVYLQRYGIPVPQGVLAGAPRLAFFGDCWASNMSWLMVLHAMAKIFGTNIQDSYAS